MIRPCFFSLSKPWPRHYPIWFANLRCTIVAQILTGGIGSKSNPGIELHTICSHLFTSVQSFQMIYLPLELVKRSCWSIMGKTCSQSFLLGNPVSFESESPGVRGCLYILVRRCMQPSIVQWHGFVRRVECIFFEACKPAWTGSLWLSFGLPTLKMSENPVAIPHFALADAIFSTCLYNYCHRVVRFRPWGRASHVNTCLCANNASHCGTLCSIVVHSVTL